MLFYTIIFSGLITIQFIGTNALKCFKCDSINDLNCVYLQGQKDSLASIECNGNCSVWIDGTRTVRGCEIDRPDSIILFENCITEGCNDQIFPKDRTKCVKCSANDPDCFLPTPSILLPCRNYLENDQCYTTVMNSGGAFRGCMSDEDDGVNLCNFYHDECIKCAEPYCNSLSGMSQLRCFDCYDKASCGYTQTRENGANSMKICETYLGRENFCFAFTNETTYIRGCLNDFPNLKSTCAENTETCQICDNDDYCNDMKLIAEFCVDCDSQREKSCKSPTNVAVPTLCGDATYDQAGCYLHEKGRRVGEFAQNENSPANRFDVYS